jgi:protein associated with RNAse G/E
VLDDVVLRVKLQLSEWIFLKIYTFRLILPSSREGFSFVIKVGMKLANMFSEQQIKRRKVCIQVVMKRKKKNLSEKEFEAK